MSARGGFRGFSSGVWHVRANTQIATSTEALRQRLDRLEQHLAKVHHVPNTNASRAAVQQLQPKPATTSRLRGQ